MEVAVSRATVQSRLVPAMARWSLKLLSTFFALAVVPACLYAQQPTRTTQTKKNEARLAEQEKSARRRARAVGLIIETAEAARAFDELFYRARIQTLAAAALWPHDALTARSIFIRAWEAATAADKAEEESEERESGVPSDLSITEARDEVLAQAAVFDPMLAETFLRDLIYDAKNPARDKDTEATTNTADANSSRTPWGELSAEGARRLALADELLRANEATAAAQIAAPVVSEGTSAALLAFILRLREQNAAAADALYARLLQRTRADARSDANDVSLLSAPIVSPQLLVVVDAQGAVQFQIVPRATNGSTLPPIAPAVRNAFYQIAADILVRPVVPRAGASATPEAVARYFVIGRLLPFFAREAAQFVPDLRLRSSTLMNEIEAMRRERLDAQFELSSLTQERAGDPLRAQTDQLGRARDALDRDRIALGIVKTAARLRLWDRARRAATEIEDADKRRAALSFIAVNQIADITRAFTDDRETNFESLAKFVREADVPPLAAAWGLAQTSALALRQGNRQRAVALLYEAERFAGRTSAGTHERVAAYILTARFAADVDAKHAWELLPEVVRAANALKDYTGEGGAIDILASEEDAALETEETLSVAADVFRLDALFATMARVDADQALTISRSLGGGAARAIASLAIARVMLKSDEKRAKKE